MKQSYITLRNPEGEIVAVFLTYAEAAAFFGMTAEAVRQNTVGRTRRSRIINERYPKHTLTLEYEDGSIVPSSAKNIRHKVRCIETGEVFNSISEAAEVTGVRYGGICNCCRGAQYTSGGYHWEYVDD